MAPSRVDRGVVTTPLIDELLASGTPVGIGVSGGKDSCLLGFAVQRHLDEIGHDGPRVLIHADLGRVEWRDSLRTCQRLADRLGLELVVVRRPSGDMMDRWLQRWSDNVDRYRELACATLIGPWSSSKMRFCTSELKVGPICRELTRRWPGQAVLNAVGLRREESAGRLKAPIAKPQPALRARGCSGWNWNPILEYTERDVFARLAAEGFAPHEGYTRYGMTRISCRWCVLGSQDDLVASASCPDDVEVFREMVDLEIASTFSFQGHRWLGDVAPHLLSADQQADLRDAKHCAQVREREEARIPERLRLVEGVPGALPTVAEARLLADVRLRVAAAVGLDDVRYLDGDAVRARYAELMGQAPPAEGACSA